jgi:hypothetical protein
MRRRYHVASILLVLVAASCAATNLSPIAPARISVCELASNPAAFNQKSVELSAVFLSDLRHGHILKDSKCEVPYLTLKYPEPVPPSVLRFEDELNRDISDLRLKVYSIKLRGIFIVSQPHERVPPGTKPPIGRIMVDDILFSQRYEGGDWRDAPNPPY